MLDGGKVYDATDLIGLDSKAWPPTGMVQLIAEFEAFRPRLEQALRREGKPMDSVALEAPLVWPHKLLAYPVNYLAHGHEMNSKIFRPDLVFRRPPMIASEELKAAVKGQAKKLV